MASQEQQTESSENFLASAVKVLIVVASIGVASVAGFYVHPRLLPLLTDRSLSKLWAAAHDWLTAPILFLLVNLVVGTIYFSSGFIQQAEPVQPQPKEIDSDHERSKPAAVSDRYSEADRDGVLGAAPLAARPSGIGARIGEKTRPFTRLVRSKSEQIMMKSSGASGRLKKAGTFESAARDYVRKKVVVVADPAVEEVVAAVAAEPTAQEQEVDKKAEDFISRFYQKVKLQRLDSLLSKQQGALIQGAGQPT